MGGWESRVKDCLQQSTNCDWLSVKSYQSELSIKWIKNKWIVDPVNNVKFESDVSEQYSEQYGMPILLIFFKCANSVKKHRAGNFVKSIKMVIFNKLRIRILFQKQLINQLF